MANKLGSSVSKSAWKAKLSASHRGARPGKARVMAAPKIPTFNRKVK